MSILSVWLLLTNILHVQGSNDDSSSSRWSDQFVLSFDGAVVLPGECQVNEVCYVNVTSTLNLGVLSGSCYCAPRFVPSPSGYGCQPTNGVPLFGSVPSFDPSSSYTVFLTTVAADAAQVDYVAHFSSAHRSISSISSNTVLSPSTMSTLRADALLLLCSGPTSLLLDAALSGNGTEDYSRISVGDLWRTDSSAVLTDVAHIFLRTETSADPVLWCATCEEVCGPWANCSVPTDIGTTSATLSVATPPSATSAAGVAASVSSLINGTLSMGSTGRCACLSTHTGARCDQCSDKSRVPPACSLTQTECSFLYCGGPLHGLCHSMTNETAVPQCLCLGDWTGPTCTELASVCGTQYCSGHGRCSSVSECTCDDGWFGTNCSQSAVACRHVLCSGTGQCMRDTSCVCDTGYQGYDCGTLVCLHGGTAVMDRSQPLGPPVGSCSCTPEYRTSDPMPLSGGCDQHVCGWTALGEPRGVWNGTECQCIEPWALSPNLEPNDFPRCGASWCGPEGRPDPTRTLAANACICNNGYHLLGYGDNNFGRCGPVFAISRSISEQSFGKPDDAPTSIATAEAAIYPTLMVAVLTWHAYYLLRT